jgi:hypothetical protein
MMGFVQFRNSELFSNGVSAAQRFRTNYFDKVIKYEPVKMVGRATFRINQVFGVPLWVAKNIGVLRGINIAANELIAPPELSFSDRLGGGNPQHSIPLFSSFI